MEIERGSYRTGERYARVDIGGLSRRVVVEASGSTDDVATDNLIYALRDAAWAIDTAVNALLASVNQQALPQ